MLENVPLLTPAEKAAELRVHTETLRRWRRANQKSAEQIGPEYVEYGGVVRYLPEAANQPTNQPTNQKDPS